MQFLNFCHCVGWQKFIRCPPPPWLVIFKRKEREGSLHFVFIFMEVIIKFRKKTLSLSLQAHASYLRNPCRILHHSRNVETAVWLAAWISFRLSWGSERGTLGGSHWIIPVTLTCPASHPLSTIGSLPCKYLYPIRARTQPLGRGERGWGASHTLNFGTLGAKRAQARQWSQKELFFIYMITSTHTLMHTHMYVW